MKLKDVLKTVAVVIIKVIAEEEVKKQENSK